jgi:two-component system, OmpR family, response regulator CpxR
MVSPRVLLVDDDQELTSSIGDYLRLEDFDPTAAPDASVARRLLSEKTFDIIVLDIMMPSENGITLLRDLRRTSEIPVLMLTARAEELDRILGLELGADDYLAKPFHLRELAARLRAILRRFHRGDNEQRLRVGALLLDRDRLSLELDNAPVKLTSAEFMVLEALMRDPGKLLSRAALTELALGRPLEPYERSVDTHVSNLRRKLGSGGSALVEIRSVRGKGYLLRVEARSA